MAGVFSAVLPPVRLDRDLLDRAREVAAARDETLSQVVRRALRDYVAGGLAGEGKPA